MLGAQIAVTGKACDEGRDQNESSMSCYQMPYVSNGFKWRIDGYASSCFDFLVKNVCNVRVGLALWY